MKGNIQKLLVFGIFQACLFHFPVFVLLFQSRGISDGEIFWIEALYSACFFFVSVPAGYISDRWGRKNMMILGSTLCCTGLVFTCAGYGFLAFAIGEALIAIGTACQCSAQDALLYESIPENEKHKHRDIASRLSSVCLCVQGFTGIVGGYIVFINVSYTVYLTFFFYVCAAICSLSLEEPERHELEEKRHWKDVLHILRDDYTYRLVVLWHGILCALLLSFAWYMQMYQRDVGIPQGLYGWLQAGILFFTALATEGMKKLKNRVDDKTVMIAFSGIVFACYMAAGVVFAPMGITFFIVARSLSKSVDVISNDVVSHRVGYGIRATALAMRHCTHRFLMCIMCIMIGVLVNAHGLSIAILHTGVLGGFFLLMCFFMRDVSENQKEL